MDGWLAGWLDGAAHLTAAAYFLEKGRVSSALCVLQVASRQSLQHKNRNFPRKRCAQSRSDRPKCHNCSARCTVRHIPGVFMSADTFIYVISCYSMSMSEEKMHRQFRPLDMDGVVVRRDGRQNDIT